MLGADRVWIERDGVGYLAEQIGGDPLTNVALIRSVVIPEDLQFLRFREKAPLPAVGSFVVALTSELGMPPGPSMGMVNGHNTRYGERILPTAYIRTDIPVDGGEGGAPVFDLNGSLVGITILSLPTIRASFVLPVRALERVLNDIMFSGDVAFAHFGFTTLQIADIKQGPSVVVEAIEPGGPAEQAGIEEGDTLLQVGEFLIQTDTDLREAFFFTRPNEHVAVRIQRGADQLKLLLKAGVRQTPPKAIPEVRQTAPRSPLEQPQLEPRIPQVPRPDTGTRVTPQAQPQATDAPARSAKRDTPDPADTP